MRVSGVLIDVDDRKRSQLTLLEARDAAMRSEQKLRDIILTVKDGMVVLDKNDAYTMINPAAAEMMGVDPDEIIGRNVYDVWPTLETTVIGKAMLRAQRTGEHQTLREYFEPLGRHFDVRCFPNETGLTIYFLDVTQEIEAEAALRKGEEINRQQLAQLQSIYRTAPVGLSFVDKELNIVSANELLAELQGSTPGEIVGRNLRDVLEEPMRSQLLPVYDRVLRERESCVLELNVPAEDTGPDARPSVFLCRYSPVLDETPPSAAAGTDDEAECIGVNVVVQDISDLQRAMEDLRASNAAVRKSEQTQRQSLAELDAVYDSAPVGLAFVDKDLRYIRVNRALAMIDGCEPETMIGKRIPDLLPPDVAQAILPTYEQVLTTGKTAEVVVSGKPYGAPQDQPDRTYLGRYSPVVDVRGDMLGLNVVVQDITDIKLAEARLEQQSRELERQRNELQRQAVELRRRGEELSRRNRELSTVNDELAQTTAQLTALLGNA
ncbi:MAG: PAS domain-containing protein, partial [Planctomycetota bacterium]